MSKDNFFGELTVFLESKGHSLEGYGSAEYALHKEDALYFLELLAKYGLYPLGIESWRDTGDGLAIDTLGGWYCESKDSVENLDSAKDFLEDFKGTSRDSFTIQF